MGRYAHLFYKLLFLSILLVCLNNRTEAQKSLFRVLVIASPDPDHGSMINKAKPFFEKIASENNFELDFSRDAKLINEDNLSNYQVFVQLHLAPFEMTTEEQKALQHFISRGKGWLGIHAAGLTGNQFMPNLLSAFLFPPRPSSGAPVATVSVAAIGSGDGPVV